MEIPGAYCPGKGYKNYIHKTVWFQWDAVSYEGSCQMNDAHFRPIGVQGEKSWAGEVEKGKEEEGGELKGGGKGMTEASPE